MKSITLYEKETYKDLGDLFGLFFEDINHAADGGLYAELIQNRSFEFCELDRNEYHALTAWNKSDTIVWSVETKNPINEKNKHYLHMESSENGYITNDGFLPGVYIEKGKDYDFSLYIKSNSPSCIQISVIDEEDSICATTNLSISCTDWNKYETRLHADKTTCKGKLKITFLSAGIYDIDMVSLFPTDTFLGKKCGLRKDIATALQEMKPKFMRFPGGCLTHDGSLDFNARNSLYRWKGTLGAVEQRATWRNNWGYNQTLGLGYFEYFCFCEEIGAKPLPVLAAGFNPHKGEGAPMDQMQEWVDDALDLIEFANGDEHTTWGKIRCEMGHKEPFHLEYIGIGNEEIGDGFFERYPLFHHAIREKYPDIKIINSAGPFAVGEGYEAGWTSAKKYGSDLVDEHYYSSPEWFLANMHHYDDYDENGPKVFLGEYASWGNTFYNALVEAAYMTHLEKAKAVALACYAPMLCNASYVNWSPDMLWFDNHRILKTPNYYVQKLFMNHQGTKEIRFEAKELDETIALVDVPYLFGNISIERNDIDGNLSNIVLTNHDTGERILFEDTILNETNAKLSLGSFSMKNYTLSFHFKRTQGRKGLKIFFGGHSEGNTELWEFGGWDNWDCNIASFFHHRASTISHRIFHVEDIDYDLRLEVNGRHIKTYVNNILWNDTIDHLPELDELYASASIDETTGETILKVVNLTGENKEVSIMLPETNKKLLTCYTLYSDKLDTENTFEKPDQIIPNVTEAILDSSSGEVRFMQNFNSHSVNILVFS